MGLNKKNFEADKDENSNKEFDEFPSSGHFICSDKYWKEVATVVSGWINKQQ